MNQNIYLKFLVLGNSGVGKSSLLYLYKNNYTSANTLFTCGLDIVNIDEIVNNEKHVNLIIFDTAGQEKYRSMAKSNFHKADAVLFVYAINDRQSFNDIERWISDLRECNSKAKMIIIANKADRQDRVISIKEGEDLAAKFLCPFFETSIYDDLRPINCIRINDIFKKLILITVDYVEVNKEIKNEIKIDKKIENNNSSCSKC